MDKIKDITKILEKLKTEEVTQTQPKTEKVTNPIFKKLAHFKNTQLSKKFDINDLI